MPSTNVYKSKLRYGGIFLGSMVVLLSGAGQFGGSAYAACITPNPNDTVLSNQVATGNCPDYTNKASAPPSPSVEIITSTNGTAALSLGTLVGVAQTPVPLFMNSLLNNSYIESNANADALLVTGNSTINQITNNGYINYNGSSANNHAMRIGQGSTVTTLNNYVQINQSNSWAILSAGTIGTINNSGTIYGRRSQGSNATRAENASFGVL